MTEKMRPEETKPHSAQMTIAWPVVPPIPEGTTRVAVLQDLSFACRHDYTSDSSSNRGLLNRRRGGPVEARLSAAKAGVSACRICVVQVTLTQIQIA